MADFGLSRVTNSLSRPVIIDGQQLTREAQLRQSAPKPKVQKHRAGQAPEFGSDEEKELSESEQSEDEEEIISRGDRDDVSSFLPKEKDQMYKYEDEERLKQNEKILLSPSESIQQLETKPKQKLISRLSEEVSERKKKAIAEVVSESEEDDMIGGYDDLESDNEDEDKLKSKINKIELLNEDDEMAMSDTEIKNDKKINKIKKKLTEIEEKESESETGWLSEEESENSDSENEENNNLIKMFASSKPAFVAKAERRTKDAKLTNIDENEEYEKLAKEKRESAQQLLKEVLENEVDEPDESVGRVVSLAEELGDPSLVPNDEIDDIDKEFELWKERELNRLKRDYEEMIERKKLAENIERRRKMLPQEREEDDRRIDREMGKDLKKPKAKLLFMQKYYHKGAFFQDIASAATDDVYTRDYNAPVGEDKLNKELLPSVMRLRRGEWGHRSRSKHTHLADVDTTDKTSAFFKASKTQRMIDGAGDDIALPDSKKKKINK